jgi:YD repeat-containing protein
MARMIKTMVFLIALLLLAGQSVRAQGGSSLLSEDFNDGDMQGWVVVDEGTIDAPSQWSVQNGRLAQTSNIYGPSGSSTDNRKGTFAYWTDSSAFSWTDYSYEVTVESTDNDGIGLMFRYQDANNYYKVDLDKQRNFRKLFKIKNGVESTLASEAGGYTQNVPMQLGVTVIGDQITVSLDGAELFGGPVVDSDLGSGTVALYAWGNPGSYFDDVQVLPEGSAVAPVAPVNLSVTPVSSCQIDLNWEDTSNEDGFRVEHCADAETACSSYAEIAQVGANQTNYSHAGLEPLSTHSYRVIAFNAAGDSPTSNVDETTTLAGQSCISYVYDELGRLVGVVDPNSDAATYIYDAVGNILSILRASSSAVSIIEFTPDEGPLGSTVTIYGTGFSATPSENTVKFNGVVAAVTSAAETELAVVVPAGATTGLIDVTAPGGSATSSSPFTVAASSAPSISGFSPTIGAPGTPVTINGTNFELTPALNNKTRFNVTLATVDSATATSINTTVPSGVASGKVSVTTLSGQAVSSADFFVPPFPHAPANVEFTGRMAVGGTQSVALNTAGNIGLLLFDGIQGKRTSLLWSNSTFGCGLTVSMLNPYGNTMRTNAGVCFSPLFLEPIVHPVSGTYTALVDPDSSDTGSVTVNLYDVVDITGPIVADGPAVDLTFTTPGQNALLTFDGTTDQEVSVWVTNSTFLTNLDVFLKKPDGTNLVSIGASSSSVFFTATLPEAGTYTLLLNPRAGSTGSATVKLYDVAPVTATITPGGGAGDCEYHQAGAGGGGDL